MVGRKMDNERSALRSNKEFSSQLQQTKIFDTNGRDLSFSSARLQKKPSHGASLRYVGVGLKKRAREMSYECLDRRKCCHATL